MRDDVYGLVIGIAEEGLAEIKKQENIELGMPMTLIFTTIIGICGGASAAEKTEETK